ncbi:MAG TPA: 4-alpha-glucanotransferase [Bryobacteraceae bacterium]|nr:4-alpha-glucanotransferase [Bryobacteraceae bacterium]
MAPDTALRAAAERLGIQQQFWDNFGVAHVTSDATNRAIVEAIAASGGTGGDEESFALVVSESEPFEAGEGLEITTEQGERIALRPGTKSPKLPLGYHQIRRGARTRALIVTPDRAWQPSQRMAGFGVTLWGLRSARNWGCGDFRDLRDLIDWAIPALGVHFIALNPLHALHNRRPYNISPYLPNTIFYRNFLYLDVESLKGYRAVEDPAELERLRQAPTVEYEQVAALKRAALERIFESHPPDRDCLEWIEQEGELLRIFATYSAIDEHLHKANPDLWIWPDWPAQYRDPSSPAVTAFAAENPRAILFHGWLQWLIDRQIADVQRHALAAGMSLGLYHDLALATDRCGCDLWAWRPYFITGCRVGSPPDGFSPNGQDWSFPPPNSTRHRSDGYRLFAESIRKSMRHGGALRIDHVMRLFRLYWIPEGHTAREGAYVRERAEDLVRVLALESVRNRAVIVGEDLGTVEDETREMLARFGILSYKLLFFERNGEKFRMPPEYRPSALTSTSTHDLATIAGYWVGDDIEARFHAGAIDDNLRRSQHADRTRDKQKLLEALFEAGLLPQSYERDASRIPELTGELHYAIAGFLATTPCSMWLINQEDLTKELHQQNLPGTTAEYPNWGRKMRWTIEELSTVPEARDCASMLRHWVQKSRR